MTAHTKTLEEKLDETVELLDDMVSELNARGCGDEHDLIRRVGELRDWLQHYDEWKTLDPNADASGTIVH